MYTEISHPGEKPIPSPYTKVRPNHGMSQILTMEELTSGMVVVKHSVYHTETGQIPQAREYRIEGIPYLDLYGAWWITVISTETNTRESASLADMGVVQYGEDLWNKSNWLENPSKVPDHKE